MAIFILRKNKASCAMALAVDKPGCAAKFCTFFVDKIVRKARHAMLSP